MTDELMTETIQILRRSVTEDSTGDQVETFTAQPPIPAWPAQVGPGTEMLAGRNQVQAQWAFVVGPETVVGPYDHVMYQGLEYRITGPPIPGLTPDGMHHLQIMATWIEG